MFKRLSEWFAVQITTETEQSTGHTVELSTAVLLMEIMRADRDHHEAEREAFFARLKSMYSLSDDELNSLHALSGEQVEQAADFVQYTKVINERCSNIEKREILDSLWHVAMSDGHVAPNEEHLIRRIADLMHMPHSQFIQSKLSVKENHER